jgi:hypothetical protein
MQISSGCITLHKPFSSIPGGWDADCPQAGKKMTTALRQTAHKLPRIRYRCPSCTDKHEGFPALAYAMPDAIFALPVAERDARAVVSGDLCIIDDKRFFIRCVMAVPVLECDQTIEYGPWVEVASRDFSRYAVHFNGGGHPAWAAAEGNLANAFPASAQSTLGLSCMIRAANDPSKRPNVEILDHTHAIQGEQLSGVSLPRAMEIVGQMKGYLLLVD